MHCYLFCKLFLQIVFTLFLQIVEQYIGNKPIRFLLTTVFVLLTNLSQFLLGVARRPLHAVQTKVHCVMLFLFVFLLPQYQYVKI